MTEPLLEVTGLSADHGRVRAVHDVSLAVGPGRITAVLGANGAGKTSLLRAISGLLPRSGGTVRFRGEDLARVPVEGLLPRGLAHVPEGRGVIGELTVTENLALGGLWRGRAGRAEAARATAEVYELFPPLARRRSSTAYQLSGGERQMLALGRALVARPALLLLDEPSLGLAPAVVAATLGLLRRLRDATGLAVLLVEQNVTSALSVADDGVVLHLGRTVARGSADELLADETVRRAYLGF
jgi:branched-chain amino acid transport system ATP-binding protein